MLMIPVGLCEMISLVPVGFGEDTLCATIKFSKNEIERQYPH